MSFDHACGGTLTRRECSGEAARSSALVAGDQRLVNVGPMRAKFAPMQRMRFSGD
jgi:hypothetical protein